MHNGKSGSKFRQKETKKRIKQRKSDENVFEYLHNFSR